MRTMESKYESACAACGADLAVGQTIGYERRMGAFCVGCIPTDTEDIRRFRQAHADRRADRYESWGKARERRADRLQAGWRERSRDWAYVTQPGHIPQRARDIRSFERSMEELKVAGEHMGRAASVRASVRVAGDAEKRREKQREHWRAKLRELGVKPGDKVEAHPYGVVTLVRINAKSATVRTESGFQDRVCLSWIARVVR